MQKRTTAQLLAEALAFTGRHATETEQQAAHRRLQRNQMAATELLRLDALRLELQTQLADYKEACTKAETRADQAEGRAKLMAAPAVPQGWRDAATAALTLLNKTQRALGNNLAKHPADHSATVGELMGMHDCRDGFLVRSGLSGILNDTAPSADEPWPKSQPVRLSASRIGRVYVAGPMTGIAELNFPAFNQEAERLRAEGLQVLNPADHGIVDGADWADYLRHDIAGLASCERIHLLRGWTKSKGACLEMTIAKALGMTVTYQVDAEMEHNNAPAVPQGEPVAYIETITGRLCAPLDEHRLKFPMCYEPLCKQGTAPAQEVGLTEAQTTHVRTALQHAWQLGQVYWQQADSNYTSEHKKSDETQQDFEKFCDDIIAALRAKGQV